ncbi:MAG: hypothetical protein R2781_09120 [Flavobacteriaceae bacterium]
MKKNLLCKLFGHHLIPIKKEDILLKEYVCSCCDKKFTVDGYGRVVKFSKYWEQNNLLFEKKIKNRAPV